MSNLQSPISLIFLISNLLNILFSPSHMSDICNFCLGGNTDIPPFGTASDAKNLLRPCSTCSLVAHHKCILDWFHSLPSDSLHVFDAESLNDGLDRARSSRQGRSSSPQNGSQNQPQNQPQNQAPTQGQAQPQNDVALDPTQGPPRVGIEWTISTSDINQWLSGLSTGVVTDLHPVRGNSGLAVILIAPCPQCKNDIIFTMNRSQVLTMTAVVRTIMSRGLQYSGAMLGLTSAVTGVVSMGYLGLTSCGINMLNALVPGQLLVRMLAKPAPAPPLASSWLALILLPASPYYAVDGLELAVARGMIDPLKFSRIPLLPVVMYRMRSLSPVECITRPDKDRVTWFQSWFTEAVINGYISSLGNHALVRRLWIKAADAATTLVENPVKFARDAASFLSHPSQLSSRLAVDWWHLDNMISLLVPIRLAYDIFFRLTINMWHFDLVMGTKPRAIGLPEEEIDRIESIKTDLEQLQSHSTTSHSTTNSNYSNPLAKLKLRVVLTGLKLRASFKHDYSTALIPQSFTLRCLTTVIWPFVSAKVGKLVYKLLATRMSIPSEKLLFLSNIIGLIVVVFGKDIANYYLGYIKCRQVKNMAVVKVDEKVAQEANVLDFIPGGWR